MRLHMCAITLSFLNLLSMHLLRRVWPWGLKSISWQQELWKDFRDRKSCQGSRPAETCRFFPAMRRRQNKGHRSFRGRAGSTHQGLLSFGSENTSTPKSCQEDGWHLNPLVTQLSHEKVEKNWSMNPASSECCHPTDIVKDRPWRTECFKILNYIVVYQNPQFQFFFQILRIVFYINVL